MLVNPYDLTDQLYDPINHLTQTELMEKFNLAFYEAQSLSKNDVISTFNDNLFDKNEINEDDYLIDYLVSNSNSNLEENESKNDDYDFDANFNFDDFVVDFDQNVSKSEETEDTETYTTDNSFAEIDSVNSYVNSSFYDGKTQENALNFIDFDETFSGFKNELNFDDESCESLIFLPPIETIRNKDSFNTFLRRVSPNNFDNQNETQKNDFGHLINQQMISYDKNSTIEENFNENQMILTQNDALLNDDPFLNSDDLKNLKNYKSIGSNEQNYVSIQCKWENCYQIYETQASLVKHIEKCHVELKRGEEFTCYWLNCPRNTKPFNARYKLLIHMRVHSGEKPNKCPFKGCNKAFSRLENLKIHQRSHTGERPYLCQFPTCPKSFSNSSDRAKHQRTHFDTKPYACQVFGCLKKYTDPSSLRKHVKNHSAEEQQQVKKKIGDEATMSFTAHNFVKQFFDASKQKAVRAADATFADHSYSTPAPYVHKNVNENIVNIKRDLKNKLLKKEEK